MKDESSYYGDDNPALAIEKELRHDIAVLEMDLANLASSELISVGKSMLLQKRLDLLEFYAKYGMVEGEQE